MEEVLIAMPSLSRSSLRSILNEVEYAGCAIFTEEARKMYNVKDVFDIWVDAYYKKAKEFEKKENKSKAEQLASKIINRHSR